MSQCSTTFSIIIPTYNRAALTARAVDSALASSSCGTLEVLVVDDASTDGSPKTLASRYADQPRVRLLALPANQGPSAARNLGIKCAAGRFLLFLDSDDTLVPDALAYAQAAFDKAAQMQVLAFEGSALDVQSGERMDAIQRGWNPGWRQLVDWPAHALQVPAPEGSTRPSALLEVGDLAEAVLFDDLTFLSGTVLRREAVRAAGRFSERFRFLEDWHFMARVCQSGPGGYLDHSGFRRETGRADQLSSVGTVWLRAVMHQRVLDTVRASCDVADGRWRRRLRRAQAAADYRLGRALLQQGRYRQARRRFARAMRHGYKLPKALVWSLASRFAPGLGKQRLEERNRLLKTVAAYFANERH